MSDTIDGVIWSLGAGKQQLFCLPDGAENPDEELLRAVRNAGYEAKLKDAFERTEPFWYGLWTQSPLSSYQSRILHAVLAELLVAVPRYKKYVAEFLDALEKGGSGHHVNVELATPGHVDLGFVTTFVHCPHCKAEGPFKRWQNEYPVEPIDCPVCGFNYSPAQTYSCERHFEVRSIVCDSNQS